ncbi:MAG TPA: hypothetical protein VMT18_09890, partial [Planctomycetota bacterium]|nr:hypothetical protein [Planctomycetota bacterium]
VGPTGTLGPITTVTSAIQSDVHSSLAWNGSGYTLAWWRAGVGTNELRHARLDAAGALLDPGGLPFGQGVQPSFPAVSSLADGNAQVVWVDFATTPAHVGDVFGTRLSGAAVAPAVAVAASASRQGFPDLAADANGYAAVFATERAGAISIVAQRMDATGAALDPEPIELGAKASYGAPQVAWNGQHYLVVWHDLLDPSAVTDDIVLARRVAADGTPIDPAPFQVLQGADPSVAAVGGTFLVAARFAFTTQNFLIQGARVDAAGQVLDASPLAIGGNFARWPQVASFGDRWLVAWQRNPTHDNPSANAMARVVLADGSMAAVQSLGGGTRPDAAASPSTGLVAWGGGDVMLQRVAADGSLLGPTFVGSAAPETQAEVAAGWNGAEFVVAWEDRREAEAFFDDRHDVYAARVSEGGVVLDPAGVPVANSPDEEQMPAVAGRDGTALVAWAGQVVGAPHATVRTSVARLSTGVCSAANFCVGAPNSAGSGAVMSHTGSTSVSADDLVLRCDGAVLGTLGIFYYGTETAQAPFGNGFRCIGGQAFRLAGQFVDAGGTVLHALDLANPPQTGGQITPGSTWHFQFWFRDTPAGGAGFNLSDGLAIDFCD